MNFAVRDNLLHRDLVVFERIGPSLGFAADLFIRFTRHFALEPLALFRSTGGQATLEVSSAACPKHRLNRRFGGSITCKAEVRGFAPGFSALYGEGSGAGG